jgi:hypothetical protein
MALKDFGNTIYKAIIVITMEIDKLKGGPRLIKITPAQKLKVSVAVLWVCLLIGHALWGERYLEATGLGTDSRGNVYFSLVDSYRAEVGLKKISPSGKRLWYRVYKGNWVSDAGTVNMVRITSKGIYQIVNQSGKNSSYLTVLKYEPDGRRHWARKLTHQPYFKDFAWDGNVLEIIGMDREFASLVLNRLQPDGEMLETLLIFNPFGKQRTWFQRMDDGVFLATEQARQLKIVKVKPEGEVLTSFTVGAGRLLGLDRTTEAFYLAGSDRSQVAKYSDTGNLLWRSRLKRQWNSQTKEDLRLDYLETATGQNTYLAGKAQLFTVKPNYKTIYDPNAVRYFDRQKFWRRRGGDRVFIAKFNSDGVLAWTNYLVTNQHNPKVGGMAVDQNGNVYLAGNFVFLDARHNLFLAKYNRRGKLVWIKRKYQIPGSLFYLGLIGSFLVISIHKHERRVWSVELAVLIGLIIIFWGEALV